MIDASASSQFVSALLLAGARYDDGVDVRHDGKPVPSLPHIDMTVAMLREHGVDVDDSEANRWAVAPGVVKRGRPPDRARPVQRRAVPGAGRRDRRPGHGPRLAASTTQAGDALREILTAAGLRGRLSTDDGLTRRRPRPARRHRRRPARRRRADSRGRRAVRARRRSPSHLRGIAHIRGHETDRLAALATELGGLGADVTEHPDGLSFRPGAAARRGLPHLRRPPDGARRRDRRRGRGRRAGRERRDDRQDVPRLRRLLVRAVRGAQSTGRYSDQDVEHYDRPRRRTRPRTKDRPTYDDAVDGVVVTVDRGRYTLLVDGPR